MYCIENCIEKFFCTYKKIQDSGLLDIVSNINVVLVGDNNLQTLSQIKNFFKVKCHPREHHLCEAETLQLLWDNSKQKDFYVLYLHSKGVTRGYNPNINSWIEYMEYFCINKYRECLDVLQTHDTVGVNLLKQPHWHYSGNFWWSKSEYINKLKRFKVENASMANTIDEKMYCEYWLLDNKKANPYTLHQSNIDHYWSTYPESSYKS